VAHGDSIINRDMKQTYFQHDSNARNDIKIIKLRKSGGYEFYGIYFALLEILFLENNKVCVDDYDTLAFALQCDTDKLIKVINNFGLFIVEDNCFYSKRLNDTINTIHLKSEKARENANKRWNTASKEPNYPDYYDIHFAKRIAQDDNATRKYHKHLEGLGYKKKINYNGETKWEKTKI
tara:strand:+ start:1173 stop:1709 length:537 start_codon:yes stop_codon:yes gene_type:complete